MGSSDRKTYHTYHAYHTYPSRHPPHTSRLRTPDSRFPIPDSLLPISREPKLV
ncbi:hypothetical protein [Moorena bouillonii]|uniref:hypothetical protein n=1 Tax=Moorena bouillonii TaxID=207920 RepID=UPI0013013FEA|nr:hypothetical protein [Moorena bouillonii]